MDTSSTAEDIRDLIEIKKSIEVLAGGKLKVEDEETIYYDGTLMNKALARRIFTLISEQGSLDSLIAFMENLVQNSSFRAVNELYGFLDACNLPITKDGCFLAYKKVGHDYKDLYSRTFDNSLGKEVSMPRNHVDEDKNRTCSAALHCCSFEYLTHYGTTGETDVDDRVVEVAGPDGVDAVSGLHITRPDDA